MSKKKRIPKKRNIKNIILSLTYMVMGGDGQRLFARIVIGREEEFGVLICLKNLVRGAKLLPLRGKLLFGLLIT